MKRVRLLHTSDLHVGEHAFMSRGGLDEEAQHTLKAVVDFSLANEVDLFIIAGDFFDSNRVNTETVEMAAAELRRTAVPVVILPGNHDCLVPATVYRSVNLPRLAPNIRLICAPEGETLSFPELDLAIWGKPLRTYGGKEHPLSGIPPRGSERWQIAVAHGYYVGDGADPIHSFQLTQKEMAESGRDYIALGHWSIFGCVSEAPVKACYSGSASHEGKVVVVDLLEDGTVRVESRPF